MFIYVMVLFICELLILVQLIVQLVNGKLTLSPSVTYGTNGFFIMKDSGNSVTDQSGEGNNFSVNNGTLTKTEDNPSNIFATLNVISVLLVLVMVILITQIQILVQEQVMATTTFSTFMYDCSTGKFYCEMKWTSILVVT